MDAPEEAEQQPIASLGPGDAGAREHRGVGGPQGGDDDHRGDDAGSGAPDQPFHDQGRNGFQVPHLGERNEGAVDPVHGVVDPDRGRRAEEEDSGERSTGVLDFTGDGGDVGPAVVGPQHAVQDGGGGLPEGHGCGARGEVRGASLSQRQAERDDRGQRRDLEGGESDRDGRTAADGEDVDDGEDEDHAAGHGGRTPVQAEEGVEVVGEHDADGGGREGLDQEEVGPAEGEGGAGAEALVEIDVQAAGPGELGGQFGDGEGAEKREEASQNPEAQDEGGAAEGARDGCWGEKDAAAENDPDHDGGSAPEPDAARKLGGHPGDFITIGRGDG